MNKDLLIYITGLGIGGAIGMTAAWHVGRKSYRQGFSAGMVTMNMLYELKEKMEYFSTKGKIES